MQIQNNNPNIIITTSRKNSGAVAFGKTEHRIQDSKTSCLKDNDKRYNMLGAVAGASILAILGVALLNIENGLKMFKSSKKNLKQYLAPKMTIRRGSLVGHGGPEFKPQLGPKYIDIAWNNYIKGIKERRSKHNEIAAMYKNLLKDHKW